ncbi:MAG TPA: recombinase family protein, partial [Jatrophihabitans sp.]
MAPKTLSWAIYARISQDRNGAGLATKRQIQDCRALGRKLKLPGEPVIYQDDDISASSGKLRPDYERLLTALRGGKHQVLIVWHPDRLHRRNAELENFIDIVKASHVTIQSVNAGEFDLSSSSGQMQARIVGAVAQREVEQKAERRARAIQQNAGLGKRHGGGRTFGYGRTVNGHDRDIEKLNAVEARLIRSAFERILAGESTTSVWRGWNGQGVKTQRGGTWSGSNFRRMIQRPS